MPADPNEWPPPVFFKDHHGKRKRGDGVYLRCEIVGFSDRGTPYVRPVDAERRPFPNASIYGVDDAWLIDGRTVIAEKQG